MRVYLGADHQGFYLKNKIRDYLTRQVIKLRITVVRSLIRMMTSRSMLGRRPSGSLTRPTILMWPS